MEIERKFLVRKLPENLDRYDCKYLEQAYISTAPVIRIRAIKNIANNTKQYVLTVKSEGMLAHQEYELEITESAYNNLMQKTEGNTISKYRYIIPLEDKLKVELDVFTGDFDGVVMGEIEFPTEEYAKKYDPPAYLGKEVTFDKRFHNNTMTKMSSDEISALILFTHENS